MLLSPRLPQLVQVRRLCTPTTSKSPQPRTRNSCAVIFTPFRSQAWQRLASIGSDAGLLTEQARKTAVPCFYH